MKVSGRWSRLVAGFVGLFAAGAVWHWWYGSRPDNLLLVTLDTTRADRLGCYGYALIETPALDALAAQGCLFENAFTPVPLTLPSHASLMTGLYPPEHGLRINGEQQRLSSDIPVLAERLQHRGYRTGAFVGSFVLDHQFGLDRGFDSYDDRMEEARNSFAGDGHAHGVRTGQRVVDAALRWLQSGSKPFFCWVHLFDAHTPYDAREELFAGRYRDQPYDAGVAYVDRQVGRLMEFLHRRRWDERTVVVVLGDHGESLGEHQERTHGFTLYNATLRVPLIIRWAGKKAPVRRISTPVSLVDVLPTLNATLMPEESFTCSGRSLRPACEGDDLPAAHQYAESDHPLAEGGAAPLRCLFNDRWKYVRSPKRELYDLLRDPLELQNLANQHPELSDDFELQLSERESAFVKHATQPLAASSTTARTLASLGYAGGGRPEIQANADLPDVKDLLPYFNQYSDAQLLMGEERYFDALQILKRVAADVPGYARAWFHLGVCYHELGRGPEAAASFERALSISDHPATRWALGKVYLSQRQPQQAIPHLEQGLQAEPDSAEGRYLMGMAYLMQGQKPKAREFFEQALEADSEFMQARMALEDLVR